MEIDRTSHSYLLSVAEWKLKTLEAENQRLRAALQKIINEAETDDSLSAWASNEIARRALKTYA